MYPKHMSTRICEQNPLLPPIAIGNMEKFIHACKIIETLETDVRLPLSIVAGTEAGPGRVGAFSQRGVFVHQNLPRNCRVSGEAEEHQGGPCPGRSSMSDRYVAWGGGAGFRSKPVREYKKLQDAYPNGGRLMVPTESPIRVG